MSSLLLLPANLGNSAQPKKPIAIVEGQAIYEDELPPSVQGQLQRLRQQEFDFERAALEELVRQRLLQEQAKKENMGGWPGHSG